MNELIVNKNLTMSSLEIAALVGSRHDHVMVSIKRLIKGEIIQSPSMREIENKQALGPRNKSKAYIFSGEQGKRDSIIVVAQLSPEFTGKLVDRWLELEKQAEFNVPKTLPEALKLAYEQAVLIEEQQQQLAAQQPAVEFVDRYVEAHDTKSIREVAKILHVGERWLATFLQDNFICFRQGVSLLPYAHHIKSDYFRVKTGEANGHAWHQTRFTPRGVEWISKKVNRVKWAV